jgi:hypothetical protein
MSDIPSETSSDCDLNAAPARQQATRPSDPPLSPASIALWTLLAGPLAVLFPGLKVIARLGAGARGKWLLSSAALLFPILYVFLIFSPTQWYWSSLVLMVAHLACTTAYYLYFRRLKLAAPGDYPTGFPRTSGRQYTIAGIAGGLLLVPLLGLPFIIGFLLGIDRLLSTLMPVAFDDSFALVLLVLGVFSLALAGAIAGGRIGRLGLNIRPLQLLSHSLGLVWVVLLLFLFLQLAIVLPGFLTAQIDTEQAGPFALFGVGLLCIGSWWSTSLLFYTLQPATVPGRVMRLLQMPLIVCSSALIFALFCGYPANWFHSTGKYLEKEGRIAASLWCYERGMSKKPSGLHAGYLQYRIALLAHKLGEEDKARAGFRKVVSLYNQNENLTKSASKLLDNIDRNEGRGKRVVLPGVETPTAYKGAYCVPNSLALVMRYWGADVDATAIGQAITGLDSGTIIVDQAWYAEQEGFRHDFLPVATMADIVAAIDAGFPVLVYVPAHVFAIVGYDEVLETLITYDVATRDIWVDYLQKDFIKAWKKEDTTMVVVYPPDRADRLPATLRTALAETSGQYLHYHLHALDAPAGYAGADHLLQATEGPPQFFLPLVTAYKEFPALRASLLGTGKVEPTVDGIIDYFGADFDEGAHLAGQRDYDDYVTADKKLATAIAFLIGTEHLDQAAQLIEKIGTTGELSNETQAVRAMLDLARNDLGNAIPRLTQLSDSQLQFYLAQSFLLQGNVTSAIAGLTKTIDDCT